MSIALVSRLPNRSELSRMMTNAMETMQEVAGAEQRRSPRFKTDVVARVIVESPSGLSSRCQGRVQEISSGGMKIALRHELAIGRTVRVALTSPLSGVSLFFRARVRNRLGDSYGFELTEFGAQESLWLDAACDKLANHPPLAS